MYHSFPNGAGVPLLTAPKSVSVKEHFLILNTDVLFCKRHYICHDDPRNAQHPDCAVVDSQPSGIIAVPFENCAVLEIGRC